MSVNMLRECSRAISNGVHFGVDQCIADKPREFLQAPSINQSSSDKFSDVTKYIRSKGVMLSNYNFSRAIRKSHKTIKSIHDSGDFEKLDALIDQYKRERNIEKDQ